MSCYRVIEHRMYEVEYLIEAKTEEEARQLNGDILEENEGDSWGYEVVRSEETT